MKTISPPGSLMTEVAGQLLVSAEALGYPADVVATTSGAEFGYGFTVPDDVFDHWFLSRREPGTVDPKDLETAEAVILVEPEPKPEPKRKGRGVKAATTDETGA
jgi:hypothetical protein